MATSDGTVKKTPLKLFSKPRSSGIIAINLKDDYFDAQLQMEKGSTARSQQ